MIGIHMRFCICNTDRGLIQQSHAQESIRKIQQIAFAAAQDFLQLRTCMLQMLLNAILCCHLFVSCESYSTHWLLFVIQS